MPGTLNNYRDYKIRLEGDTTLDILKMDNVALVLAFVHDVFRAEHAVIRPEGVMIERLTAFMEEINESEGRAVFEKPASYYLDYWSARGVLSRRHTDTLEVVYGVTPAAERAHAFVEGMDRRQSVGADSKFKLIAQTLQDLSENSDPDAERRVRAIEKRIAALRDEQHALNLGTKPKIYTAVEKQERYRLAVDLGRELQRDFGVIRERFKVVARTVAEQYSGTGINRGDVLRRALEDDAILRKSAEGQSFTAFQIFLLDPQGQIELRRLVEDVESLPEINPEEKKGRFLRELPNILLVEAQAVVATNERLSEQLRRVLDSSSVRSRAEAQALIKEIMVLAYSVKQAPPKELVSFNFELETTSAEAAIRPMWREPVDPPRVGVTEAAEGGSMDAFSAQLAELATVDFARLKDQIDEGFARLGNGFTLRELVEAIPPEPALAILDVLGYLELARRDPEHCRFRPDSRFRHILGRSERVLVIPDVEYYRFEPLTK